ncbi:hypothetical protein [Aquimarina mytili]|uniref:Uncharacterized protein n=1 Tax=Aquimarina mytili TaxID=874423 RepID=A0A937DAK3_9FLAO|nr:hypothetical protein [Aquimarina mytili]MBL0686095.1 hypothetical protein [Aquimarina mytili]
MSKRTIQIDVVDSNNPINGLISCNVYIDGRPCAFWTTEENYDSLIRDGFFLRDGKTKDSAGVINTSATYYEK